MIKLIATFARIQLNAADRNPEIGVDECTVVLNACAFLAFLAVSAAG